MSIRFPELHVLDFFHIGIYRFRIIQAFFKTTEEEISIWNEPIDKDFYIKITSECVFSEKTHTKKEILDVLKLYDKEEAKNIYQEANILLQEAFKHYLNNFDRIVKFTLEYTKVD